MNKTDQTKPSDHHLCTTTTTWLTESFHTVVSLSTSNGMNIAVNDAKTGTSIAPTRLRPR
jgi:hypothetical protein